jgi:hypothetical protein
MAELPFERLLVGVEVARGTPLANPTRYLNLAGTVSPKQEIYRPDESRGTLAEFYRSVVVRQWSEFEAEGGLDVYTLPLLLNALIAGNIDGTGATPAALTVDPAGANNAIDYEAVTAGAQGNRISITYIDPDVALSPLDIDVSDQAILVYLETGAGPGNAIVTIGDDITAAIAAHPVASLMVTAVDSGADDGSGVVTAMPLAYLTGGVGANITIPAGGATTRLWTFAPTMNADDLDTLTFYWGDPNIQQFQSDYNLLDEMVISADASGTDGATVSIKGQGHFPAKQAPGAVPAMLEGPLLMPANMQLWIDTVTIGTTPITGRVVSAEATIPSAVARKWLAAGPAGALEFQGIGRGKRHAEMKVVFELPDMTQYDLWTAHTDLKVRLRINGPLIEGVLYNYVEVDIYGPFDALSWGEHEGTNRTAELTILSEYNDTAGYDFAVKVQSNRDSL